MDSPLRRSKINWRCTHCPIQSHFTSMPEKMHVVPDVQERQCSQRRKSLHDTEICKYRKYDGENGTSLETVTGWVHMETDPRVENVSKLSL